MGIARAARAAVSIRDSTLHAGMPEDPRYGSRVGDGLRAGEGRAWARAIAARVQITLFAGAPFVLATVSALVGNPSWCSSRCSYRSRTWCVPATFGSCGLELFIGREEEAEPGAEATIEA